MWAYEPDYDFFLIKRDGTTYNLRCMVSCHAALFTANGVNQINAIFIDPNRILSNAIQPHTNNIIILTVKNRAGEKKVAFTGYINQVHKQADPTQGEFLQIIGQGPSKLWDVARMSQTDVLNLARLYSQNIAASLVLKLSAQAVGFPLNMLKFYGDADAGPGFQPMSLQNIVDPQQQTWSAPMQALLANTGIEWFFNADGSSTWRQIGFLDYSVPPLVVPLDDVLAIDLQENDEQAITSLEVRYTGSPNIAMVGLWPQPNGQPIQEMRDHLVFQPTGDRHLVVTAPWLYTQQAANNLAGVLGLQYAATLFAGSVTIPADPTYAHGLLVQVPALTSLTDVTVYYIDSVSYALQVGQGFVMTLGLTYGRGLNQQFPYLGKIAYPQPVDLALGNITYSLPRDPANASKVSLPFIISPDQTLDAHTVSINPTSLAPGSVIQVRDAHGNFVGPSPNGTYVTVADTGLAATTLGMKITGAQDPLSEHYITVLQTGKTQNVAAGANAGAEGPTGALPGMPPVGEGGSQGTAQAPGANYRDSAATPTALVCRPVSFVGINNSYGHRTSVAEEPNMYHLTGIAYYAPDGPFHTGIDLPKPAGTDIVAPVDGVIVHNGLGIDNTIIQDATFMAELVTTYGFLIIIQAGDWYLFFAHTQDAIPYVDVGKQVKGGSTVIGHVDSTGKSSGNHLHFGIYDATVHHYIDPTLYYLEARDP
jgi:murein DD-endopeptidase MepM/ murein hydrolase activator NlpD